jgi:hypothetical protein
MKKYLTSILSIALFFGFASFVAYATTHTKPKNNQAAPEQSVLAAEDTQVIADEPATPQIEPVAAIAESPAIANTIPDFTPAPAPVQTQYSDDNQESEDSRYEDDEREEGDD